MFGGGEKRPQLCPACGALVGINATRCHECGANLRFGLAAWSKGLSGLFGGHAPVTIGIVIVNFVFFAVELAQMMQAGAAGTSSILFGGEAEIILFGASFGPYIFAAHQWYRLITAMFLHMGVIHIGFNMLVLMDIGPMVEEVYGSARYLFAYVFTGALGFLASALVGHFSVGASGAIMGVLGALIGITSKRGGFQAKELRSRLIGWVVSIFALSFLFTSMRTDNWAHGGGLVAGLLIGRVFADRLPAPGRERTRAYALGWLAGLAVITSFVMMVLFAVQQRAAQ